MTENNGYHELFPDSSSGVNNESPQITIPHVEDIAGDIRSYFDTLMQNIPAGYFSCVWTTQRRIDEITQEIIRDLNGNEAFNRISYWISSAEEAAEICNKILNCSQKATDPAGSNIYFCRGISKTTKGSYERIGNNDADGILDFCIDLDYGSDAHKCTGYPETEEEVLHLLDVVKSRGLDFTIVLNSGHGIQVRIRLDKPWLLNSDEDRKQAKEMSIRLQSVFEKVWKEAGYRIDSTIDLGRVMRVAGTMNYKIVGSPMPVRLLAEYSNLQASFNLEELDQLLPTITKEQKRVVKVYEESNINELVFNPKVKPDQEKLSALVEADMTVKEILSGSGKAVNTNGQPFASTSERDMSIATRSALRGWTAQEVLDLIIYSRQMNHDDLKLNQLSRYLKTVEKAMASTVKPYNCRVEDVLIRFDNTGEITDEERDCLLDEMTRNLNLPGGKHVTKVMKSSIGSAKYYIIEIDSHIEVMFEGISTFKSIAKLINTFADQANVYLDINSKTCNTKMLLRSILAAAVIDGLGAELSDEEKILNKLREYLKGSSIYKDAEQAFSQQMPYYDEATGYIWFYSKSFFDTVSCDSATAYRWFRLFSKLGIENKSKRLTGDVIKKAYRIKMDQLFDKSEIKKLLID